MWSPKLRCLVYLLPFLLTAAAPAESLWLPVESVSDSDPLWIAMDATPGFGSTVVEIGRGRRVFLPFQADVIVRAVDGYVNGVRVYRDHQWQSEDIFRALVSLNDGMTEVDLSRLEEVDRVRSVQWFTVDEESGAVSAGPEGRARAAETIYLPRYFAVDAEGGLQARGRFGVPEDRPRIYQMLPRLFGNENATRAVNGSLRENGVGKFSDLSEPVLTQFREDGFTHIWLTGVLQQATSTDYPEAGQRADDPDLLKGIAGSPYAIKDYFDVSPDYAEDPGRRLEEFKALAERMHAAGLKVVIDFVPNHVARSYESDIRPDLSFGENDRKRVFFHPDNNFFYLTSEVTEGSAPLRLPTVDPATGNIVNETARLVGGADGLFAPERVYGRVTGNNVVSWTPSQGDWYETVKLNYGFNFLDREAPPQYPSAVSPGVAVPDTWRKMDSIIAYWQEMGVDGFRADMAHMVPPEFWKWMIHRAKERDPEVFFFAEAYNDDPAKVPSRDPVIGSEANVMVALLDAGFHAVYDDPGYDTLEHLYTQGAWANDLQDVEQGLGPFFFENAVRYAENHDEIRLAHPESWGALGMEVGRPVTGTLWGLSRGPVMLYHGQEVGEPGLGREGFGGDDRRSTIFDYWSLPELNKWWNAGAADGAGLSPEQRNLRAWYVRLLQLQTEPAFTTGETVFLNHANRNNEFYGKVADVGPAGHWFFAYVRSHAESDSRFLVATNFHADATLRHVRIRLPDTAVSALALEDGDDRWLLLRERLNAEAAEPRAQRVSEVLREGVYLESLGPLQVDYWELEVVDSLPEGVTVSPSFPQGSAYLGAPPLTRVRAGGSLKLDLRRFGNPGPDGRFELGPVDGIEVDFDRLNLSLELRPDLATNGLKSLPLRIVFPDGREPLESVLPLAVESVPTHRFVVWGTQGAGSVSVVGSFNGWNQEADPMIRRGGNWVLEKTLLPGRYPYKFIIDGRWETDPNNSKREPDGYGGFNSLAVVEGKGADHPPLTTMVRKAENDEVLLESDSEFVRVVAHAVPEEGGAFALPVETKGRLMKVDTSGVPEGTLVRVIAEDLYGRVGLPAIAYAGRPQVDIWRDDIIYYAFTDRFHDGDPDNSDPIEDPEVLLPANYLGGDFAGIARKLEEGYFEALGVNVLWLAPLNENPDDAWQEYLPPFRHYTGYHGYWPSERRGVEQRFGGADALHQLIDSAHSREMKVLADLVLKHVHSENPVRTERPELFGQLELSDGSRNLRRWDDNPFTTWFEPFLPAFDFRNPESIAFLLDDATYWIDAYQLDGYRLDAVKHIRPDFWWRFRSHLRDSFPDANLYFVGETFQSREGIRDFVGPNMLDGQFDFPLYDVLVPCFAQGVVGFDALENALRQSEEVYGRTARMSALLGNHDKARFMAYADGDLPDPSIDDEEEVGWTKEIAVDHPQAYDKLKMAMTFLLSIDGVPMIYYGDEIGMTGAGDPDNRRMMRFGAELSDPERDVRAHFARLAQARRAHPALFLGSRRVLVAEPERYAFVRAYAADRALVVFNRSAQSERFSLDLSPELEDGILHDVVSGRSIQVRSGMASFDMPPLSSAVFLH